MGEWTLGDNPTTGDCAQAIEEIRPRLAEVEKAIRRIEDWQVRHSMSAHTYATSAPDVPRVDTWLKDIVKCPRCDHKWIGHDETFPHPGNPCPKCAEKKLSHAVNKILDEQFLNDYVAERERWLKHACPVAFDVYWRNKQKGGE